MSSTIDLLLTYVRPYWFRIMILFLVTVFVGVGYLAYKRFSTNMSSVRPETDVANAILTGKDITITFYHVDWCPHCKKAMPEWSMFNDEYNGKTINGYKVSCIAVDCSDDSDQRIKDMLTKKKIDSFPTIHAVVQGADGKEMTIRFQSKTTKKNLEKFVLSVTTKD